MTAKNLRDRPDAGSLGQSRGYRERARRASHRRKNRAIAIDDVVSARDRRRTVAAVPARVRRYRSGTVRRLVTQLAAALCRSRPGGQRTVRAGTSRFTARFDHAHPQLRQRRTALWADDDATGRACLAEGCRGIDVSRSWRLLRERNVLATACRSAGLLRAATIPDAAQSSDVVGVHQSAGPRRQFASVDARLSTQATRAAGASGPLEAAERRAIGDAVNASTAGTTASSQRRSRPPCSDHCRGCRAACRMSSRSLMETARSPPVWQDAQLHRSSDNSPPDKYAWSPAGMQHVLCGARRSRIGVGSTGSAELRCRAAGQVVSRAAASFAARAARCR